MVGGGREVWGRNGVGIVMWPEEIVWSFGGRCVAGEGKEGVQAGRLCCGS